MAGFKSINISAPHSHTIIDKLGAPVGTLEPFLPDLLASFIQIRKESVEFSILRLRERPWQKKV